MRQKKADTETMGRGDTVKIRSKISPASPRLPLSPSPISSLKTRPSPFSQPDCIALKPEPL